MITWGPPILRNCQPKSSQLGDGCPVEAVGSTCQIRHGWRSPLVPRPGNAYVSRSFQAPGRGVAVRHRSWTKAMTCTCCDGGPIPTRFPSAGVPLGWGMNLPRCFTPGAAGAIPSNPTWRVVGTPVRRFSALIYMGGNCEELQTIYLYVIIIHDIYLIPRSVLWHDIIFDMLMTQHIVLSYNNLLCTVVWYVLFDINGWLTPPQPLP